jgi:hypothetical protein
MEIPSAHTWYRIRRARPPNGNIGHGEVFVNLWPNFGFNCAQQIFWLFGEVVSQP